MENHTSKSYLILALMMCIWISYTVAEVMENGQKSIQSRDQVDVTAIKGYIDELEMKIKVLNKKVNQLDDLVKKQESLYEVSPTPTIACRPKTIAFSASLSNLINEPHLNYIVPFDIVSTNEGEGYNSTSGKFTVPYGGTYVLMWTIGLTWKTTLCMSLRINGQIASRSFGSTPSQTFGAQMINGMMTLCLNRGDVATIETCDNFRVSGMILSDIYRTSTFNGWRIGECSRNRE